MGEPAAPGVAEKELRSDQEHATPSVSVAVAGGASSGKKPGSVGAAGDAATKRIAAGGGAASADPDLPGDLSRPDQMLAFAGRMSSTAGGDLAIQVERLGTAGRLAFATYLPAALDDAQREMVRNVFRCTPDGEVATLEKLIAARFAIRLVGPAGEARGIDWDGTALRRAWRFLEALPAPRPGDGVALSPTENRSASAAIAHPTDGMAEDDRVQRAAGEPLARNPFLAAVRHEIGHAVDEKLHLADRYCIDNPAGGDWHRYRDRDDCARAMIAAGGEGTVPTETPIAVGARRFVRSYDGSYASHAAEAHARRLSEVQLSAPNEWIAEAWAAWQTPATDGEPPGARLARVDPRTKAWLDETVAPELAREP